MQSFSHHLELLFNFITSICGTELKFYDLAEFVLVLFRKFVRTLYFFKGINSGIKKQPRLPFHIQ